MCRILFSHTSRPCPIKNVPQSFDCAIFPCVLSFIRVKTSQTPSPDPFLYTLLAFIFKLKKVCIYSRSAAIFLLALKYYLKLLFGQFSVLFYLPSQQHFVLVAQPFLLYFWDNSFLRIPTPRNLSDNFFSTYWHFIFCLYFTYWYSPRFWFSPIFYCFNLSEFSLELSFLY